MTLTEHTKGIALAVAIGLVLAYLLFVELAK